MVIMFKYGRRIAVPLLMAMAAGCAGMLGTGCSAPPGSGGPPLGDGRPQIVASIYPLAYLVAAIAGDKADVTTLVPPGTEPHDYELTPGQVASLNKAALVVYQAGVTAAVDQAVAASTVTFVETGSLVPRLPLTGDEVADPSAQAYGEDPHTWLDPANMVVFAAAIATAMAFIDPADAATYQANAATVETNLRALDAGYRSGLANCQRTEFLTTHAAFGYMAKAYGMTQLAIAGVTPEDEPSPRRLAELAQQARTDGLTTVFFETLVSPDYAKTMADDLGLRTDVLDPIEAVTKASRGTDYMAIMASNLVALREANGCQ